jgi:hypothetical protein
MLRCARDTPLASQYRSPIGRSEIRDRHATTRQRRTSLHLKRHLHRGRLLLIMAAIAGVGTPVEREGNHAFDHQPT